MAPDWVASVTSPEFGATMNATGTPSFRPSSTARSTVTPRGSPFASFTTKKAEGAGAKTTPERYDLSNRPAAGVTMDHAKPVQEGVRVKLPAGATWDGLAGMTPDQIRDRNLFPLGFLPLPHPKHQEGGMVFPRFEINEIKRQEGRDLTRFDVDFDIPDHFLPEFPPAIYLNHVRTSVTFRRGNS